MKNGQHFSTNNCRLPILLVIVVAGVCAAALSLPQSVIPLGGDTRFYVAIAKSLVSGHGFVDPLSFHPNTPSIGRPPGWPFLIAVALKLLPFIDEILATKALAGLFHVATCLVLYALARHFVSNINLKQRDILCFLTALAYGLNPSALYLLSGGWAEPSFVFFVFFACYLALFGGRWLILAGFFWGAAAFIRPNFLIFPFFVLVCSLISKRWTEILSNKFLLTTALAAFFILPFIWTCRNYINTGRFPIFVTLASETIYGANNDLVANDLNYWGYWVMPDQIPGETSKEELFKRMEMLELYDYYSSKGRHWIRTHLLEMPRLILGKLIRGFVPVPWNPSLASIIGALYRLLLYGTAIWLWPFWKSAFRSDMGIVFLAMALVNLATTIVFYGAPRFTFTVEPILFIAIAVGLARSFFEKRQVLDKSNKSAH